MAELALDCACERRTLYRYFSSKDEFFWSAALWAYKRLVERFRLVQAVWESARLDAKARLLSWAVTYLEYSLDRPEAFRIIMTARERSVRSHAAVGSSGGKGGGAPDRAGDQAREETPLLELAELDKGMLAGIAGLGKRLEDEGFCEPSKGEGKLWELLGFIIALVEFRARYSGGGKAYPFGSPEGVRNMIEGFIEQALRPRPVSA